jgi:RNA polymerase sigma-70 factor (ECF subfamily)
MNIQIIYSKYFKTIYHICYAYMKNSADAEDMVANTFLQLMQCSKPFENDEHIKAWLIRTAGNICKNELKSHKRKNLNIDDYEYLETENIAENNDVLDSVLNLPEKYKTVIYLFYYEGYQTAEIAEILKKREGTIRSLLSRGREMLRSVLK